MTYLCTGESVSDMMKKGQDNKKLYNQYSKEELQVQLDQEDFKRITVSFYRYVIIDDPMELRHDLFLEWNELGVKGRIYLAKEGINAQMNCPEPQWEAFKEKLNARAYFTGMPFKIAVEDDGKSFLKLQIKVRDKIVADGLDDGAFDVTNVGNHLSAEEWNKHLGSENSVCVDMRNQYESEIGHFEGAVCPDVDTFREELPEVLDMLEGKEDQKILLYCTGGIRCEKASAFLKHHGFEDVNQLHGGIIDYARQLKENESIDNKYKGKNFVFDDRRGERISEDIVSKCHQCGEISDTHANCANKDCNCLFIQCSSCSELYEGCCTEECREVTYMSPEEQSAWRKVHKEGNNTEMYKRSLRPKVRMISGKENS